MLDPLRRKFRDLAATVRGWWNGVRWRQNYEIVGQDDPRARSGPGLGLRIRFFFLRLAVVLAAVVVAVFALFFFLVFFLYLTVRSLFTPRASAA